MYSNQIGKYQVKKDKISADAFFMLPPEEWDMWEEEAETARNEPNESEEEE